MKPEENEMNPYQKSLLPFDPIVLIRDACKKWALVLVVAMIAGMIAYVYTDTGYRPTYVSNATLVLTTRDSSSTVYSNLDSTSSLATVFTEVLNSSVMRNNILRKLKMDSFNGSIRATAIESTNLMTVQVSARDPRTAFMVLKVLLEEHDMVTYAVMGDIVLEVLEPPVIATMPSNAVNASRAFMGSMLLAGAAMYAVLLILAYFKDVVRSKEEAEEKLNCWCLGEIFHERKNRTVKEILTGKKRSILITDPQTGFRYLNTMSKLARRVEKNMHKGKVVLVTSVMENEGKSTVSANLALALSKKYPRVLLMDCDLHKPACRKIMDYGTPAHYTQDVAQGKVSLEAAVCADKRSRMKMLFARHSKPEEAAEMISTSKIAGVLKQAREQFDYVVIDLAPMSVVSDTEVIMDLADASLLVIRQNGVRTTDLNRAIADLQRGKAELLGCVLNNVHSTGILSGEGYGTGYGWYGGYGRYGRYGKYGRYAAYSQRQTEE